MIQLNEQKIVAQKQFIQEPQVIIGGSSVDGTRFMEVTMSILNENGENVGAIYKTYRGTDFNEAYSAYATDKGLLTYIAEHSQEIPVEAVEQMPENLENIPLPVV